MVGTRLSHYHIVSELGRGGMAIVYRAEDERLGRTVALKILPASALASADDRARFYREARSAASLSHPHIAVVHEIDEAVPDGASGEEPRPFIAMELIEGESLDERIQKGPLKLDEAVRIAIEIASGLEAAHEKDIVHRDIKPSNVRLTARGEAKILDFGLAKTAASTRLTRLDSTLGTAAYMSPEQALGQEVDRRTDLWSLGVVLYEIISGKHPFPGDYEQAVVYRILNDEPEPLTAIRTGVPVELEAVVAKLLRKDADLRYQHADEVVADLRSIDTLLRAPKRSTSHSPISSAPRSRRPLVQKRVGYGVGLLLAFGLGAIAVLLLGRKNPGAPSEPLYLDLRMATVDEVYAPTITPDGRRVVFGGRDGSGSRLYVRDLTSSAVERPIPGTDRALYPFLSPDGAWVGYIVPSGFTTYTRATLYKVALEGGDPVPVASDVAFQGHWGDDGFIYMRDVASSIIRVSADGSIRDTLSAADRVAGEDGRSNPFKVPDSPWVLFQADRWDQNRILALHLETGAVHEIVRNGYEPRILPSGHLVFTRMANTGPEQMAVPIDRRTLDLLGAPVQVLGIANLFRASDARNGMFVTRYGDSGTLSRLTLLEPGGPERPVGSRSVRVWPRISPRGNRISAFFRGQGSQNWVYNVESADTENTIQSEGPLFDSGGPTTYTWSSDGTAVAFTTQDGGLILKEAAGQGAERRILQHDFPLYPTSWSTGDVLSVYSLNPTGNRDLWVVTLADSSVSPFYCTPHNERAGAFSPDGRWLAYTSDESGRDEIWVQPYPATGQKFQVTDSGGMDASWSYDGKHLLFGREAALLSIPVDLAGPFRKTGPERVLLDGIVNHGNSRMYDPHPDGKRFLVVKRVETGAPDVLQVVLNGYALLEQLAPTPK